MTQSKNFLSLKPFYLFCQQIKSVQLKLLLNLPNSIIFADLPKIFIRVNFSVYPEILFWMLLTCKSPSLLPWLFERLGTWWLYVTENLAADIIACMLCWYWTTKPKQFLVSWPFCSLLLPGRSVIMNCYSRCRFYLALDSALEAGSETCNSSQCREWSAPEFRRLSSDCYLELTVYVLDLKLNNLRVILFGWN